MVNFLTPKVSQELTLELSTIATKSEELVSITIIADKLPIHTFQGVAEITDKFIVPTLDSRLLQISKTGLVTSWVEFCQGVACGFFGAPFGIVAGSDCLIVGISEYEDGGKLVRINLSGEVTTLVNLTTSIPRGSPFGLAIAGTNIMATLVTNPNDSQGVLIRVSNTGEVTTIADLSVFGMPFAVTIRADKFLVATEKGAILSINEQGIIEVLANLATAGLGIPLGVASQGDNIFLPTNKGFIIKYNSLGELSLVADLNKMKLGVGSGIISSGKDLIVTTNNGYLIKLSPAIGNPL